MSFSKERATQIGAAVSQRQIEIEALSFVYVFEFSWANRHRSSRVKEEALVEAAAIRVEDIYKKYNMAGRSGYDNPR